MSTRKLMCVFAVILLAISAPFVGIHLIASPDEATITPLQRAVAAIANFVGPWGVVAVRLVNFPNAGLRSFSWPLALGLTFAAVVLLAAAFRTRQRGWQLLLAFFWVAFVAVWFSLGLTQIADGLL